MLAAPTVGFGRASDCVREWMNGDARPSQIHDVPPPHRGGLATMHSAVTLPLRREECIFNPTSCQGSGALVIVVFWRVCSRLASVLGHGICASCLSFGMAGWVGRLQRRKSDSSQRGSQGLAACTCVDRPASFRDPPQTVGAKTWLERRHPRSRIIHSRRSRPS